MEQERPRLYLRLGDIVVHRGHAPWGKGEVVEERHSLMPGGSCIVRIVFEDGEERSFINDLDSAQCCYFAGLRHAGHALK